MFPHTTHNVSMKWKRSSIFENIQFRYLLKELNDSWFVQYLPPLPPALQNMSVIYDHIVSEWHIEDRRRQYHAHHDHCHHVGGQEGGTWGSGSYFICLLLPPLRVGRGKGGVLSLFPNIFLHIAEKKKYHHRDQSHQHCFRNIVDDQQCLHREYIYLLR